MMYSKVDHIGIIEEIARGMAISDNSSRYLELGIAKGKCFNRISKYFAVSDAVDINKSAGNYIKNLNTTGCNFFNTTTDLFFATNTEKYNLIFIDANHRYNSVKIDFIHALNILVKDGIIILHDTYAPDKESAKHCYDAWRVQRVLNEYENLQLINLPIFYGLTIVQRVPYKEFWYNA